MGESLTGGFITWSRTRDKLISFTSFTENYPPSYKKPATPKRPPPVKKTPPQTKKRTQPQVVKEETQEYEKFPSLAGLVYIDLPTSSPPTTTTSTTTSRPTKRKTVAPVTSAKRVTQTTTQRPRTTTNAPKNTKKMVADFTCPKPEKIPFQWFPLPCDSHKQCTRQMGKNYRCCEINSNSFKACTKGIVKMVPEQKHARGYKQVTRLLPITKGSPNLLQPSLEYL